MQVKDIPKVIKQKVSVCAPSAHSSFFYCYKER